MSKLMRYWILIAFLMIGFCGASAVMLVELRRDSWTSANAGAQNLLAVLSQDIEGSIQSYDRVLSGIVTRLEKADLNRFPADLQQSLLFDGTLNETYFTSVLVLDASGNVIRDAGAVPHRRDNFADRAYFQAHAKGNAPGLYISTPFQRRLTGDDDVLGLSRRINAPDGSFAGVVVGTLKLSYFRDLFEKTRLNPEDSINLFSESGTLVMRMPYLADQIGRDLSKTDNVRRFQSESSGRFSGVSAIDGITRVYNFVHVGSLPLIINVALSHSEIFATWRTQAAIIGSILVILCLLTGVLAFMVRREFVRTARAEKETRRSEAQYRLLADHATDVIIRLDQDLVRRYVSPASRDMLGMDPADLVDMSAANIIHPDDWPVVQSMAQEARASGLPVEAIYRLRHRDGHYVWVEGKYRHITDHDGFIVVLRDISKRKVAETRLQAASAELARRANTDGLTGLANRRRFDEALETASNEAAASGKALSLLLIDVDRFKRFNDTYGHQAGDDCLRRVAQAIEGSARPTDLCARYGGEEIAVILPGASQSDAQRVGERVRDAVEGLNIVHAGNERGRVTISVGCSTVPPASPIDPAKLIQEADRVLYEAKRTGRNKVLSATSPELSQTSPPEFDETARLNVVDLYQKKQKDHAQLDLVARSAAKLLDSPIGFITLVGERDLTLIGRHGIATETVPRDVAFCSHTITGTEPMIVADLQDDPRFRDNPLVTPSDGLRFYAGAPLVDPDSGETVGTLCVADTKPHEGASDEKRQILSDLSELVMKDLSASSEPVQPQTDRKHSR